MIGRVVEITSEGQYLHGFRGFLVVKRKSETVGRVALDEISSLIVNAHGTTFSNQLLIVLADRGIPIVLCGNNHKPKAVVLPCEQHHLQGARLDAQISASIPLKKRLWQQLVKAKLMSQAAVLEHFNLPSAPLSALAAKVRSGDTGNLEGVGARRYWSLLFGSDFRRDRNAEGVNALLNYGYTILRTTVARHLIATGLQPGIGLAHSNDGNPLRLVDDLIEPFRSIVDAQVKTLTDTGCLELDKTSKILFADLITAPIKYELGAGLVTNSVERMCQSLVQVFTKGRKELSLPFIDSRSISEIISRGDKTVQEE